VIETAVRDSATAKARPTKRPVRVLFFTGNLAAGGSENHLTHLLTRMDRRRVRPELMLSRISADRTLIDRVVAAGVPIHDLGNLPGKRHVPAALVRAGRMIRRIRPDVVQTYGYPCDIYAPLLAGPSAGIRVVTTRRGNQSLGRRWLLYRLTGPLTDRVICVSESAREFAERTQGLPRGRSLVIPNGVDATRYHPPAEPRAGLVQLGTHGRIKPIKGTDLLLDALGRLGNRDPR